MPIPTEEELEVALYERMQLHLERVERYSHLGKAAVIELGRINSMSIIEVAQSYMPSKLKLASNATESMDKILRQSYDEAIAAAENGSI